MMSSISKKYEPVYASDRDSELDEYGSNESLRFRQKSLRKYVATIAILLLSNIVFASLWFRARLDVQNLQQQANSILSPLTKSPATSAIRYEKKRLWRLIEQPNLYTGKPRPEFDEAWKDIIAPITIKVSAEELATYSEGDTSIAFKDGSGYLAEMGMYHELHCVKRVRRFLSKDHYYPNMTDADRIREDTHIEHCLEYWRQSVMCRGDTTMATFYWTKEGIPISRLYTDNTCVDFTALDIWARQRMVDSSDYSQFVHDK